MSWGHQDHICCAAHTISDELLLVLVYLLVLEPDYPQLVLALGRQHQLINVFEGLGQGFLVLALIVGWQFGQFSHKNLAEELADLEASVSIEDGIEGVALADAELVDGGIFHALAPALHFHGDEGHVLVVALLGVFVFVGGVEVYAHNL